MHHFPLTIGKKSLAFLSWCAIIYFTMSYTILVYYKPQYPLIQIKLTKMYCKSTNYWPMSVLMCCQFAFPNLEKSKNETTSTKWATSKWKWQQCVSFRRQDKDLVTAASSDHTAAQRRPAGALPLRKAGALQQGGNRKGDAAARHMIDGVSIASQARYSRRGSGCYGAALPTPRAHQPGFICSL